MKKKKFLGKVAVITGASSGIGNAIAKRLSSEGAICYDISKSVKEFDFIKKSCQADVNDYQKVGLLLEEIVSQEGKIDIFINNAGFGIAGAIEYAKPENVYSQISTNLSSYIVLSGLAVKYLKKTQGRIVNISSIGGIIPLPYQASYSATKAGVEIFSRALANEVKPYNIKVTAVMPGDAKTGFTSARVIDNNATNALEKDSIRLSIAKMEKDEQKGMTPDKIAKKVRKVLTKRNPPLRISVGFWYKFVPLLTRIFSLKFINFIVRKLYCKKVKG